MKGKKRFRDLFIPGTHDSASFKYNFNKDTFLTSLYSKFFDILK